MWRSPKEMPNSFEVLCNSAQLFEYTFVDGLPCDGLIFLWVFRDNEETIFGTLISRQRTASSGYRAHQSEYSAKILLNILCRFGNLFLVLLITKQIGDNEFPFFVHSHDGLPNKKKFRFMCANEMSQIQQIASTSQLLSDNINQNWC